MYLLLHCKITPACSYSREGENEASTYYINQSTHTHTQLCLMCFLDKTVAIIGLEHDDRLDIMNSSFFYSRMHLPTSIHDRSFYANFYSRDPSEIEIIDLDPSSSCTLRTLSESPTSITPLSDGTLSVTSGFFSFSDCSSSESTSSLSKRRRPTAPTIQQRLNTYESACHRPNLPLPLLLLSKQKTQSSSALSPPSLVNQRIPRQIPTEQIKPFLINSSNLIDNNTCKSVLLVQDDFSINEKSVVLDSSKRFLSKSTSQLCDPSSIDQQKDEVFPLSSRNILDVIQEELVTIIVGMILSMIIIVLVGNSSS